MSGRGLMILVLSLGLGACSSWRSARDPASDPASALRDMYAQLNHLVDDAYDRPTDENLLRAVEWGVIVMNHDPSNGQADVLLPLEEDYPDAFAKAMRRLDPVAADKLMVTIEDARREDNSGNNRYR